MIHSMTAFASRTSQLDQVSWTWEMRGVNARGLDVRLRMPEGIDGLEAAVRGAVGKALARGNITINLRLTREENGAGIAVIDPVQLDAVLRALEHVQQRACDIGVTLAQPSSADVLQQRGVLVSAKADDAAGPLRDALIADIAPLIADFVAMRRTEGEALKAVLLDQMAQIDALVGQAADAAAARQPQMADNLRAALRRVVDDVSEVEETRVAQELALLAVKADVTEEIDRLTAHIAAARDLLAADQPIGRKLDFLAQEFNREANTLCSKAQATELTAIGLDLKAVIDQMREQVQNVE